MKPLEAAQDLEIAAKLILTGEPLPPILRRWLTGAITQRLAQPGRSLDQRLGLSSRDGGRLHSASKLPQRDEAIRDLASGPGLVSHRAEALALRVQAHRRVLDPALVALERHLGRMPSTARQLLRILRSQTAASDSRYQRNLKSCDVSIAPGAKQ